MINLIPIIFVFNLSVSKPLILINYKKGNCNHQSSHLIVQKLHLENGQFVFFFSDKSFDSRVWCNLHVSDMYHLQFKYFISIHIKIKWIHQRNVLQRASPKFNCAFTLNFNQTSVSVILIRHRVTFKYLRSKYLCFGR